MDSCDRRAHDHACEEGKRCGWVETLGLKRGHETLASESRIFRSSNLLIYYDLDLLILISNGIRLARIIPRV